MKLIQKLAVTGVAVVALVAGLTPSGAFAASEGQDPLAEIVPQVMAETVEDVPLEYDTSAGDSTVSVSRELDAVVAGEGVGDAPDSLTVEVPDAELVDDSAAVGVLSGAEGVTTHVQPIADGVRFLSVIEEAATQTEFSYSLDVPAGTVLEEMQNGNYWLWAGDQYLGTLLAPWAVDAAGAELPTTYAWSEGHLTQHVDLSSPDIAYPVVADPAWQYQFVSLINGMDTSVESTYRRSTLINCFNCYFPIPGAPQAYPTQYLQVLPLRIPLYGLAGPFWTSLDATCLWDGDYNTWWNSEHYWGFRFIAAAGHFEGVGSSIEFDIGPRAHGGQRYLTVTAWVMNDFGSAPARAVVETGAKAQWQNFANNLATP